jgi:hypothetical protein
LSRVPFQPLLHVEIVVLFAPEHAGKGLPLHPAGIFLFQFRLDVGVKSIGIGLPRGNQAVKTGKGRGVLSFTRRRRRATDSPAGTLSA